MVTFIFALWHRTLDCVFDKIVVKLMTCYGPISTKLCCEWSANASESCAIIRVPSVRIGSIPIDVVKCDSPKFHRDSSKGGIFANRGGALLGPQHAPDLLHSQAIFE